MIGIPAPTTGRTIGSTGIGGTVGIMASTMVLIGERTMTGMAVCIITIIDDKGGRRTRCVLLFLLNFPLLLKDRLTFTQSGPPLISIFEFAEIVSLRSLARRQLS